MSFSDKLFKRDFQASAPAGVSSEPGAQTASAQNALGTPQAASPAPVTVAPSVVSTFQPAAPTVPVVPNVAQYAEPLKPVKSNFNTLVITALICVVVILSALQLRSLVKITPTPDDGVEGLHVLVVYESDPDESDATNEQKLALAAKPVREWLDENCAKIGKGDKGWRILDRNVFDDVDEAELKDDVWAKLMAKKRKGEPWLYMTGGRKEISEPMVDGGPDEFVEQLERGK